MRVFAVSSDNLLVIDGLINRATGAFVNDAEGTITVRQAVAGTDPPDNDAVSGASSLSLSYVAASDGRYTATVPGSVTLVKGTRYWAEVSITSPGTDKRYFQFVGQYNTESG